MRLVLIALLCGMCLSALAGPTALSFTLKEVLGVHWGSDLVRRDISVPKPKMLYANQCALFAGKAAIPMQLENVATWPDGSLKSATVWFRTDLPATMAKTFTLTAGRATAKTDVTVTSARDVLEMGNAFTAVRLPAPDSARLALPTPLLGVRLASGAWITPAVITPPKDGDWTFTTELQAQGPIFARARVEYRLPEAGVYTAIITVRQGEPLVRVDEQYTNAGIMRLDLHPGLQPTKLMDHIRGMDFATTTLDYAKGTTLPSLTGWDFYLPDRSMMLGLYGGQRDDFLGLLSMNSDWLPFPYNNMWELKAEPGPKLTVTAPLANGQRHYAFLVAKGAAFPKGGEDLYRWWQCHIGVSLEKMASWQLEWPGMDEIIFPHTFFSPDELSGIRERLRGNPEAMRLLTELRDSPAAPNSGYYWGMVKQVAAKGATQEIRAQAAEYIKAFAPKGIVCSNSDQGAWALSSDDPFYTRALREDIPLADMESTPHFLRIITKAYADGVGAAAEHRLHGMELCDRLFMRMVGLELLLGSDVLTPAERHDTLVRLSFLTYLLYDTDWLPVNHPYYGDGSQYIGYAQGTENQKQGIWMLRGIYACMLTNHPMKAAWMQQALTDNAHNMPYQINTAGTFYESANYSLRTTSRIPPFWLAMSRAGANDDGAWMASAKGAFQFLGDLLTPPDPRFKGIRAYHPMGRGEPGNVDPTLLEGISAWGLTDRAYGQRMRWLWESMGKPRIDHNGGRDTAFHLLALCQPITATAQSPLTSCKWEGFGAIFRAGQDTSYESNVVVKHGEFCWAMGDNQGSVYFWGKGAPLAPRFGAWWMAQKGQMMMQAPHFNNRVIFTQGDNTAFGEMATYASLGTLADYAVSRTNAKDWTRSVLFAKDLSKDDPEYLLIHDDVTRPAVLHWWFMTKDVLPNGPYGKPAVDFTGLDEAKWIREIGSHWKDAPKLAGPLQRFTGAWGVDMDLFIARPANPVYVVDAAGVGPNIPYCADPRYQDAMQLVRVEGGQNGYTTLLAPRWPGAPASQYRAIADGAGVAVTWAGGEDRLFLSETPVTYTDEAVTFAARAGFVRRGGSVSLRLMVVDGMIRGDGVTLTCREQAALVAMDNAITVYCPEGADVSIQLPPAKAGMKINIVNVR